MPTRSRNTTPIHTWVLALLVAMCLAFGLSPFFSDGIAVGSSASGTSGPKLERPSSDPGLEAAHAGTSSGPEAVR